MLRASQSPALGAYKPAGATGETPRPRLLLLLLTPARRALPLLLKRDSTSTAALVVPSGCVTVSASNIPNRTKKQEQRHNCRTCRNAVSGLFSGATRCLNHDRLHIAATHRQGQL